MKAAEKKLAISLRLRGQSIKQISATLGVAKSSVSAWVREVTLTPDQKKALKDREHSFQTIENRRAARLKNELAKREAIIESAEQDIDTISRRDLMLIGSALYWAEGAKRGTRYLSFSNSDPLLIKIMMRFFKEVCNVPDEKFRGHIHTHSHLNVETAEKYWSEVSGIPIAQFFKTYSKPSKASKGKMDALPYGTMAVGAGDVKLFLTIQGWNRKISRLILEKRP